MTTTQALPVSVLVPTRNEEMNIRDCLRSVAFSDDIVVVDSRSSDATAASARSQGARVIQFDWNGRYPKKKNWAIQSVDWRNEWILVLDADERVTPALAAEIGRAISLPGVDGFYLNRIFYFLGGWIRHCGYYPSWNLRLFRRTHARYEMPYGADATDSGDNEIHEHVLLDGRSGYLEHPMLHFAYPTVAAWVEKHNRYSNWEARVAVAGGASPSAGLFGGTLSDKGIDRKRWLKRVATRLPMRPTFRFLYHYVLRQGFRDGYRGYLLCRLLGWYEFVSLVKARELRMGSRPVEE